ncbi:2-hydroxy-3-keto-5-methylthiopentenyl-1-phosphate phosphatase [Aneurinibacillus terranovensis]|uniref:2-hydroxy-3-keto-5-methylthiopentenyl-1- phosphate phosphatase n=1 Tax=Aneurinibacillus terranovensis TaxID=278991 RepID=UPI0004276E29|nr:2-hydroxy-3-keto-5-methylthiopentenyl-1-phosphate phosphatase [Aneurinibacillus terranovensis]
MTKRIVIFCDFDGTITEKDNILDIMKHFAPPQWKKIVDDIFAKKKSLREGVGELFSLIPSEKQQELTGYVVQNARIRDGFGEFVTFCKEQNIHLLVTSNGIDFFIHPILAPFEDIEKIYCNESDFSGDTVRILWPHPCDEYCGVDCGMCKTTVIRSYKNDDFKVVIGDSLTDLEGAKIADAVIARSYLKEKCEELGIEHESFTDFYDCIRALKTMKERLVG